MRIVVTGGAGFIGANLCRELLAHPSVRAVTVLDDLSTGSLANIADLPVELVQASVLDRTALSRAVTGAHAVVHLAARTSVPGSVTDPLGYHETNTLGTLHVLEACRAAPTPVVLASSSSVYGETAVLPAHEELPADPHSPYAASKAAAEAYASAYARSYGVPALMFRFFNVFGPFQPPGHPYAAVVPAFIDAALTGRPVLVHGDGHQSRDFTYVGTVAGLLAHAAVHRVHSPAPINLAAGRRTSLLQLIALLNRLLGAEIDVRFGPPRPGDLRHSQAAGARLADAFPGHPGVPLETGLARTVAWFRSLPQYSRPPVLQP
ncbi:NAD-dependent epimerase/dehydratase family protein [Actinoplanes sp. N902-109]|uniref:NAD-dependent epimerase/dehydratase family protein n=1 Tax=Actinoplanes sp. (strain N902-109) TaxID=649831 RepID=UPI0003293C6D|nr:NAD-dependent epimerase/dehydratase family protein [Actinoplanes sp. N902-109]AGL16321.1 UDP-glucose 4-epimerase [Actinoplanes sp. N902-109]